MKINPKIPQKNHNVSDESDSSIFFRYIGFFVAIIVLCYVFFISLSQIVVLFVSIEDEARFFWSGSLGSQFSSSPLPESLQQRYSDIPYTIKVIDMDAENAFADLWGNIYITQDLLDSMMYIEELDFIVGHELSHVEDRHVLKWLISDVPIAIVLSLFGWEYSTTIFQGILSNNYSKFHESSADRDGLDFTHKLNGHVWCALDFFREGDTLSENMLQIFSTHPMTSHRIKRAEEYAEKMWYETAECTKLTL